MAGSSPIAPAPALSAPRSIGVVTKRRSANIAPAPRRAPKNALSPASIWPPLAQMGFPATRTTTRAVTAANKYASAGPPAPVAKTERLSPLMRTAASAAPMTRPRNSPTRRRLSMSVSLQRDQALPLRQRLLEHSPKSIGEPALALSASIFAHRDAQGSSLPHDDHQAFSACYRRVEKVARQHDEMARQKDHDHGRVLAALRFVHSARVREHEVVEIGPVVMHVASVEANAQLTFSRVDPRDDAEVSVEDLFVVVVSELHHFVTVPEDLVSA